MAPVMLVVKEEEEAIAQILALYPALRPIVRVDGHPAAGKSRVAKALVLAAGGRRLELDQFRAEGRRGEPYLTLGEQSELLVEISACLNEGRVCVLDGILLDQYVPLGMAEELRIYVRSVTPTSYRESDKRRNRHLGTDRYHRTFLPHEKAHIFIEKRVPPDEWD